MPYLSLMRRWTRFLPTAENISPHDRSARFYGTGEKAHWPVQSNLNVAGACAVLADCMDPETESATADALRETALAYFRYTLRTHKAVQDLPTTDHGYWGCHWISVLGLERTAHAIRLLEPFLTDADRQMYDALRRAEVNSILEDFEVSAGPHATGHNHPESNTWNGCFLYRTLAEMPGLPDRDRILDKANRLLLAGISHPDDRHSTAIYQGLRESDAYVGANFSAAYGLDHHGYLNVGYAVITLSHIAMHYFGCKETDRPLPPALFHNARALWDVLRHFFFPDGRLLRIGGDTRTRYTYCQCYAIPVLLFAAEAFGDTDAPALEQGWLSLVKKEVDDTGDGSCYSKRLAGLRNLSLYYARRLESDHILSLSYGAHWRRRFPSIPALRPEPAPCAPWQWSDPDHAAGVILSPGAVRSFTRDGAQGPVALCVPRTGSDFAEWQGNLAPALEGTLIRNNPQSGFVHAFPGGFVATACAHAVEQGHIGEGEESYPVAEVHTAVAALPDGATLLCLQRARMLKDAQLTSVYGLNLLVPNDVFNGRLRTLRAPGLTLRLEAPAPRNETIPLHADGASIDDALYVRALGGATEADRTLALRRETEQNILMHRGLPRPGSLYAERICTVHHTGTRLWRCGEAPVDGASAASTAPDTLRQAVWSAQGDVRTVHVTAADGTQWLFAANFAAAGATPAARLCHAPATAAGAAADAAPCEETALRPGDAVLLRLV